jgi:hypothetical protein
MQRGFQFQRLLLPQCARVIGDADRHMRGANPVSSVGVVPSKSERQAARSVIGEYHKAQLSELVEHVADAIDRHRAGDLTAFEVDHILFQYSRAAKELWKFCNHLPVEMAAAAIREHPPSDWWERGAPRER